MTTLTITRGLPGSGKTTWAKQQKGCWVVSRDPLRHMLWRPWVHGDDELEAVCTVVQDASIGALLDAGLDVIVPDTNLEVGAVRHLRALALRHRADFRIEDFTGVPLETCIERDAARPEPERVGEAVIRSMWDRYLSAKEAGK